jgi:hypothetical protein
LPSKALELANSKIVGGGARDGAMERMVDLTIHEEEVVHASENSRLMLTLDIGKL